MKQIVETSASQRGKIVSKPSQPPGETMGPRVSRTRFPALFVLPCLVLLEIHRIYKLYALMKRHTENRIIHTSSGYAINFELVVHFES